MRRFMPALEGADQTFDSTKPFVFLGGTINGSNWRVKLLDELKVPAFNPVVADWTPDDAKRENQAKAAASAVVYALTPKQTGFYTIAEMTAACCVRRSVPIGLLFLEDDDGTTFEPHQAASVVQIRELLLSYPDVHAFDNLQDLGRWLNHELGEASAN